ncbi:MAG: 6-phosphogluconolactonase [Bacteroidales bacterium]|nr:6-phosphogluconolactonase [Bacteroidales bacterium]
MTIHICSGPSDLGSRAATLAAERIREAIDNRGVARIILSTGSSQFETLEALGTSSTDWSKVEIFHLDEYIGLPVTHKASFRKYLKDRFISKIPVKAFHPVDVEGDINAGILKLSEKLRERPVDLGLIGIGENGHIAFNDPPADFSSREAYIAVTLDEQCRRQQVGEGWFASLEDVPLQAVTMTPWQIMQCGSIISAVPHSVKAEAVRNTLINRVTEIVPATILKTHHCYDLFIDINSSSGIIPLS